jgi:hypothetical protein
MSGPDLDANRILAVHASAVCTRDGALVFLGPSGTGKSTIAGMLESRAPLVAHDVVYLIPVQDNGKWFAADGGRRAYDGPLSREEAAALDALPLRAVVRLFQTTAAPRLRPIGALAHCRYLTDALFEVAWQRDHDTLKKRTLFADLAAVCRSTPGYEFYFDLSPRTLGMLNESLGIW